MKKILILICLFTMLFDVNVQGETKPEKYRYIYLWDVTLSMKGYGGNPDIYDDVVDFLLDDIDGLPTGNNKEIIVCPFQENILQTWKAASTIEGKNYIKEEIKKYNNEDVTYTNLVDPLKYVEKHFVDSKTYEITIFLLTDGSQNDKDASMPFDKYINNQWDRKNHFLHLKLIRLTEDVDIGEVSTGDGVDIIDNHERSLEIIPSDYVNYNIIEADKNKQQAIRISFTANPTDRAVPDGIKIRVFSDKNSRIKVDETLTIENGNITIPLRYNYDDLKYQFVGKENMTLHYEISGSNKFSGTRKGKTEEYIVSISSPVTNVDLVNERQKTLKITLK